MDYCRLETKDNFVLVFPPKQIIAHEVRAYHTELINKTRAIDNYFLPQADPIFFKYYQNYYQNIIDKILPAFDCEQLTNTSRHEFFIAYKERRPSVWISQLELLMGYDYKEEEKKTEEIIVTSGDSSADLLAELFLHLEGKQIEWLLKSYSQDFLIKFVKQISDRRRGKELIEELQRAKDRKKVSEMGSSEKLRKRGFSIPEM